MYGDNPEPDKLTLSSTLIVGIFELSSNVFVLVSLPYNVINSPAIGLALFNNTGLIIELFTELLILSMDRVTSLLLFILLLLSSF